MPGVRIRPLLAALLVCLPLTVIAAGCSFTQNNNNGDCDAVGTSNSANCPQSEDSAGGLAAPPTSSAVAPAPSDQGPDAQSTSTAAAAGSQSYSPPPNASVPSIPVVTDGPGWYLYTGDGNPVPVHLTGTPAYPRWAISPVPAEIHITPATVDGTRYDYGTIMIGEGQIPAPYGSYTDENYPDWWWDAQAIQLAWANLNNKNTVIQNVGVQTEGYRVLRGVSGAYAPTCMGFLIPSSNTLQQLQLNSANDWVPVAACE